MEYFYLIAIVVILFIPLFAQIKVKTTYNKYSKIKAKSSITGRDVARKILDNNGLYNVSINTIGGSLTDYYDPKRKGIALSKDICDGNSVASLAIAAHEVGHAIQDSEGYSFMKFRSSLVPLVNITSWISSVFILLGFITEFTNLLDIGICCLLVGLFFQLITLPVEFNASSRAKKELLATGVVDTNEQEGVSQVLSAAAFTYVAGFLAMLFQILRLVALRNRRN